METLLLTGGHAVRNLAPIWYRNYNGGVLSVYSVPVPMNLIVMDTLLLSEGIVGFSTN